MKKKISLLLAFILVFSPMSSISTSVHAENNQEEVVNVEKNILTKDNLSKIGDLDEIDKKYDVEFDETIGGLEFKVITDDMKKIYNLNDNLELERGLLIVSFHKYGDASINKLTLDNKDIKIVGFDNKKLGIQELSVFYKDMKAGTFYIEVKNEKSESDLLYTIQKIKNVHVELGSKKEEVLAKLPKIIEVTSSKGELLLINVTWKLEMFDSSKPQYFTASAEVNLPNNTLLTAIANIIVGNKKENIIAEIDKISKQLEEKHTELDSKEQEYIDTKYKLDQIKLESKNIASQIESLQIDLEVLKEENKPLENEYKNLVEDVEKTQIELKQAIAELGSSLDIHNSDFHVIKIKVDMLTKKLEALKDQKSQVEKLVNREKAKVKGIEEQIKNLNNKLNNGKKETQEKLAQHEKEIRELVVQINKLNKELEVLRNEENSEEEIEDSKEDLEKEKEPEKN
ncbi:bacterial Ig-like domain-containing protein, partial [Helcococcus kunzii]|uniref:bacterial Ig-like domain-containing protein n=1 Tax=Helcococcus kunzii TaxID=40091 RepID=UPI0024AE82F9